MDNHPIAQVFSEIADLLEIKGENVFKIRAYRSAADTIKTWADPVARMDERQLLDLPGIGKDLAKKIGELAETGVCGFHQELLLEFPPEPLMLEGDFVLKFNHQPVLDKPSFQALLEQHMGQRVTLTIRRDGTTIERIVRLGTLESARKQ